jgi:hypothetical protein
MRRTAWLVVALGLASASIATTTSSDQVADSRVAQAGPIRHPPEPRPPVIDHGGTPPANPPHPPPGAPGPHSPLPPNHPGPSNNREKPKPPDPPKKKSAQVETNGALVA